MRNQSQETPLGGGRVTKRRWITAENLDRLKGHFKALLGSAVILSMGFVLVFIMQLAMN